MTPGAVATQLGLVGPTAIGKSSIAIEVARRLGDIEIITIDSMQVYRGMDIGTAKPTPQERQGVPHHLIDLVDVDENFTLQAFQEAAKTAIAGVQARGNRPMLVGGTGLYLRAVIDNLTLPGQFPEVRAQLESDPDTAALYAQLAARDPLAASRMEPGNRRRIIRALEVTLAREQPFSSFGPGLASYLPTDWDVVVLELDRQALRSRIEQRFQAQMQAGFLDEVRALACRPGGLGRTAAQALGYRQLLDALQAEDLPSAPSDDLANAETDIAMRYAPAVDEAVRATHRFARRQRAWFGRDPRLTPLDATDPHEVVTALLQRWGNHASQAPEAVRD